MKKILLSGLLFITTLGYSQQLISFEPSEGYTVGNIDGQSGWTTTGTGPGNPNITNQVITNTDHTGSGTNSLKITKETAFAGQTNPIVGAFKALGATNPYNSFTISFDMKLTDLSATASIFEFQTVGPTATGGSYHIRLRFTPTGGILAAQTTGTSSTFATTTGTWTANTWFRVKIVGTGTSIAYFVNNTQIYSGNYFTTTDFNEMRFVHDNYLGSAFIDNIAINNEASLSTAEGKLTKTKDAIKLYPNPATDLLTIDSKEKIQNVSIYDMGGRKVNADLNDDKVNVKNLNSGNYIINIETKEGRTTEKFIKK